jgi:RNA polymerase sigma-B factor
MDVCGTEMDMTVTNQPAPECADGRHNFVVTSGSASPLPLLAGRIRRVDGRRDTQPHIGAGRPEATPHPDERLEGMHRTFAQNRDATVRNELACHYDELALRIVRRFGTRRDTFEDLAQVARIGLLHAIDRYDPSRGHPFAAFAQVTISGELKRHVRDKTWTMRVSRSLQEHYLLVIRTADDLTAQLGRSPRIPELAAACGLSEEEVLEATDLDRRHRPASLDAPDNDPRWTPAPAEPEPGYAQVENRSVVAALLAGLGNNERAVLEMYYVEGITQGEIAERLGKSQMYVSRLITRVVGRLRVVAAR